MCQDDLSPHKMAMHSAWSWWSENTNLLLLLLTAATSLVSVLCLCLLKTSKKNPPLPPGPKGLPVVGNLFSLQPELHKYFADLSLSYGPIFKLKLGNKIGIVITSPSIAKQILKDQDTTFANRDVPVAGREATYGGADIVWNPYGPEWRMLRKVCVREMLSNTNMDAVYAARRREIRRTINLIYEKAGSPVDIGQEMFVAMMNVVTSMLWGGEDTTAASVGTEFKQVVGEITALLGMPNLSDFFPALERFDLQGIQKKMKGLARRFDQIFDHIIAERIKLVDSKSKDFLQILLQMKDETDAKTPFTMTHLKALLMDMVVGGTDTTSNAIEFALAEMMKKPSVLQKAQSELERRVGKEKIVEESDLSKLPYMAAVMKEALRLHPSLPLLVPHSPSSDCNVSGYSVPKGARVFINVWAMHRDPSIWENPLEFRPERFLEEGKLDYSGNDLRYFPFGSGRRMCAGVAMAERMFMHLLASMVHSFDWNLPSGEKVDVSDKFGIVLKKKEPLLAIPTPRLPHPTLYDL